MGSVFGLNMSQGLALLMQSNLAAKVHPQPQNNQIPKIYQVLQQKSPLNVHSDYKIAEVDYHNVDLGEQYFYKNYISKSLPVILRGEASQWDVVREMANIQEKDDLEDYLASQFRGSSEKDLMVSISKITKKKTDAFFMGDHNYPETYASIFSNKTKQ